MHNLIIEIGTEDIPNKGALFLSKQMMFSFQKFLDNINIKYSNPTFFSTANRITFFIEGLPKIKTRENITLLGPCLNEPIEKFLKFHNIEFKDLKILTHNKTKRYFYEKKQKDLDIFNIIPLMMQFAINKLSNNNMMFWGEGKYKFLRPVKSILIMIDDQLIKCNFFNISSSNIIFGNRFYSKKNIVITSYQTYIYQIYNEKIILDPKKRKNIFLKLISNMSKKLNIKVLINKNLIDEMIYLTEWPKLVVYKFNKKFLSLPNELIIKLLEKEQRCFATYDFKNKILLNKFIALNNNIASSKLDLFYSKVVDARLSDALFLYKNDLAKSLDWYINQTKKVIFHNKLGSLYDRSIRIAKLSENIALNIGNLDTKIAYRAGMLSKLDLVSFIVNEFKSLKGIMGSYYLKYYNESKAIYTAVKEQYLPNNISNFISNNRASQTLSIAEKLDLITSMFSIENIPTSSKDPFFLKRNANYILDILVAYPLKISIQKLIELSINTLNIKDQNIKLIEIFFLERLKSFYLKNLLISKEIIKILSDMYNKQECIYDINIMINNLVHFNKSKKYILILNIKKRISNMILNHTNKNNIYEDLFILDIEAILYKQIKTTENIIKNLIKENNYLEILNYLAFWCQDIKKFLDTVIILDKNIKIKNNRLELLKNIYHILDLTYLK